VGLREVMRTALSLITRDDYLYIRVHGVPVVVSFLVIDCDHGRGGDFLMFIFRISDIYDNNKYYSVICLIRLIY
jgi:hypothetical protein